ncbi:hypothetical protein ACNTMW_05840 [Planosporangium sp. 12N6]|uniref:hypothetical protein n=1 Tax=Planosporangium spinosum TaxID=3402278 RepID=UPI003CF2AE13
MYRQGDVLAVPVTAADVPADAVVAPVDRLGRFVLARGEATGHAHVVAGPRLRVVADPGEPDRLFVEVVTYGRITHEEHGPIALPAGFYRVVRQREYIPGSYRPVAD